MSENQRDPQYKLRWPEDLRDKIMESAKNNNRSMNAEIVHRLEQSFNNTNIDISELLGAATQLNNTSKCDEEPALKALEDSHAQVLNSITYAIFNTLNKSGYSLTKEEIAKAESSTNITKK